MDVLERPLRMRAGAAMVRRARRLTTTFRLSVGDVEYLVEIVRGEIVSIERGLSATSSWQFSLEAEPGEWAEFWSSDPAPGHNDIMAMRRRKVLAIDGDPHPLMSNLRYFKELLGSACEARS